MDPEPTTANIHINEGSEQKSMPSSAHKLTKNHQMGSICLDSSNAG